MLHLHGEYSTYSLFSFLKVGQRFRACEENIILECSVIIRVQTHL